MFLMPFPIGIILLVIGLFALFTNRQKLSKIFIMSSLAWFFLLSYGPIVNPLLNRLESTYPALQQAPQNIRYIYILGAGNIDNENYPLTAQVTSNAVIRLNEGIRLYRQLNGKAKIIVSGYSKKENAIPHAYKQKRLAIALGVPEKDIIAEPLPKNTKDEALAAKKIVQNEPFILVTSAFHMKRAMGLFRRENLHPIAAPTDYFSHDKEVSYADAFNVNYLEYSNYLFHEYIGILWSKLKGDI